MATQDMADFLPLIGPVLKSPHGRMTSSYDREADVLYVSFEDGAEASDSELTDDDIIVRYRGDEMIGLTILHAAQR
jgi:uncharacterized protein YuzE